MRAAAVVAALGRDGCRFAEQLLCAITLTEDERELRKEQKNIAAQDRVVCGLAERLFAQRLGFSYVTWILRQAQERSRANRPRRRVRNDRFDLATRAVNVSRGCVLIRGEVPTPPNGLRVIRVRPLDGFHGELSGDAGCSAERGRARTFLEDVR